MWISTLVFVARAFPAISGYLTIPLIFSFFWTSQVIKNIVHVTAAGCFATWYFLNGTGMPADPTLKSFRRATTYSFGSICLGSLLVAIVKTIRAVLQSLRNQNATLACIVDCILGCIDSLLRFFNNYAFAMVAIYGKSYWNSAKDTFALFERSGVLLLVNDNIISTVIFMVCLIGGCITAVLAGGISYALVDHWYIVAVVAFFIGFSMLMMTMEVVESGTSTLFVCYAEDPMALQRNDPVLYDRFHHHGHQTLL